MEANFNSDTLQALKEGQWACLSCKIWALLLDKALKSESKPSPVFNPKLSGCWLVEGGWKISL